MSRPNTGIAGGDRNLLNRPGAGKGDKERSFGWRDQYDNIDFHREAGGDFKRNGSKLRKVYGTPAPAKHGDAPKVIVH